MSKTFDVCVIGSGPGGYVAAIRAAQEGLNTVVIEREALGGVCLNVGCIPSKAMITASHFMHRAQHDAKEMGFEIGGDIKLNMKKLVAWKQSVCDRMSGGVEQLLKGNKVEVVRGEASFKSSSELEVKSSSGTQSIKAKNYIVATGSRPIEIPGFAIDEKDVLSSTGALAMDSLPKEVVVIGGGYIGLEIGTYLAKLGTKVTVLEAGAQLLSGLVDKDCVQVIARRLKKNGVDVQLEARAKGYKKSGGRLEVVAEVKGKEQNLKADKILLMVGRKPNSDQMNLKGIGLAVDERGFAKVNPQCRTNIPHIFAIGDIAGQPMLAHKASHEGILVAEVIAGKNRVYDAKTVPAVIFTDPEIASAGWTEEECKAKGYTDLKVGKFPFAANGRAVSMMETDGFVKIIANAQNNVVLGVHIVGPEASNLISEAVLAIEMGATLEDLALSIHPHPTLGETMMEAAEATLGHAIHIIQKPLSARKSQGPSANA
ncbi:MAG: dihydrolipoyl dehydrogenase [Pseudobdellovibrionaceae bacterium]|nr:MAG: dihydrolipoyl dehydrogenase [Pseudobdellovibrionaceae bacterium]